MNSLTFINRKHIVLTLILCLSLFNVVDARNLLMDYIDSEVQEANMAYAYEKQRNLQTISNPHGLRIKYIYNYSPFFTNTSYYNSTFLDQIYTRFNIAGLYFKQILKVTDTNESNILLTTCGYTYSTNSTYGVSGFSFDDADMITFVVFLTDNPTNSIYTRVPYSGYSCQVGTWIQYGFIYNYIPLADPSYSSSPSLQTSLNFLIREHVRMLAFNGNLVSKYKKSYMSSVLIPNCQVVATHNNYYYIITPNVKAYVQKFFNCDQSSLGARFNNNNYIWSREQFYDEIFSDIYLYQAYGYSSYQVYMTELTLSLFKDTGFYYNVDFSYAEYTSYGKDRGCDFARGYNTTYNIQPQYCINSTFVTTYNNNMLDYYNRYFQAYCNKTTVPYVANPQNYQCINAQQRTFVTIIGPYSNPYTINCYKIKCFNNNLNINVTINSSLTVTCTAKAIYNVTNFTLYCPGWSTPSTVNFNAMCNRKYCGRTQCSPSGYCVQGSCLSQTLCSTIDPNCVKCKGTTCTGCSSGLFPTQLNSTTICETCKNVLPTCTNGCEVTSEGVTICKVIQSIVPINGTSCTCIAVRFCLTCNVTSISTTPLLTNGTFCLTCENDTAGNKRYPTIDQQSCVYCSYFIPNCITCNVTNGVANCSACSTGLYPDPTNKTCVPCSYYINSCVSCNVTIGIAKCITCTAGQYPNLYNTYCYTCRQFITNCTTCAVTAGVANCSACDKYLTPDSTGANCIFCKHFISNCSTCANSTFCLKCDTGLYTTGSNCKVCRQLFTNCTDCFAANEQSAVCTSCDPSLYTIGGDCKVCWQLFDNCTNCTVSSNGMAVCSDCYTSLYTLGKNCKPCSQLFTNCTKCSTNAEGIAFCSECNTGLYTVGGNCKACGQLFINCTSCNVNDKGLASCVNCVATYQPNMNGTACRSVFCVTQNCHLCYNQTNSSGTVQKCQECLDSFYLIPSSNKCQKCRQGCATCSQRNRCGICIDGYYRITKGCYRCPRQCTKCQTKKGCFGSFDVVCV